MSGVKVTDFTNEIGSEIKSLLTKEKQLEDMELLLQQNKQFRSFLALQKEVQDQSNIFWKNIEEQMIKYDIKSVSGDWGSVTIAERLNWDINEEELPKKFLKKVVDTTKLSNTFRLEGKAPKGASPRYTKYLTKRIK